MSVSFEELVKLSRNPAPVVYDLAGDAKALSPHMERVGITTRRRKAAFLANCVQETDYLKTLEEYGDEAYFRTFLGDQWRFHGRGYLMNSWRDAYERLSRVLDVDLVKYPDLLATNKNLAARAAVWFWDVHELNRYADQGRFLPVASKINRGELEPTGPVNGWDIRLGLYRRALDALDPSRRFELWPAGFERKEPRLGNYEERHPTRYWWHVPVEGLIRRIYREFGRANLHMNTYYLHPGDDNGVWARDSVAFDVWGPGGRNDPLDRSLGDAVLDFVYNDPNPPWIDWSIWKRRIRTRAEGYTPKPFGTDAFSFHDDHIHLTMVGPYMLLP